MIIEVQKADLKTKKNQKQTTAELDIKDDLFVKENTRENEEIMQKITIWEKISLWLDVATDIIKNKFFGSGTAKNVTQVESERGEKAFKVDFFTPTGMRSKMYSEPPPISFLATFERVKDANKNKMGDMATRVHHEGTQVEKLKNNKSSDKGLSV